MPGSLSAGGREGCRNCPPIWTFSCLPPEGSAHGTSAARRVRALAHSLCAISFSWWGKARSSPPRMQVEARPQVLHGHGGALNVPARDDLCPASVSHACFAGLDGLPQGKVAAWHPSRTRPHPRARRLPCPRGPCRRACRSPESFAMRKYQDPSSALYAMSSEASRSMSATISPMFSVARAMISGRSTRAARPCPQRRRFSNLAVYSADRHALWRWHCG